MVRVADPPPLATPEGSMLTSVPAMISMLPEPERVLEKVWAPLMSNFRVPLSVTAPATEPLVVPSPSCSVAPPSIVVAPVMSLVPVRVSVPPEISRPPPPEISPEKAPAAAVRVRDLEPSVTLPEPDSDLIDAPALDSEMSNRPPLSWTPEDWEIEAERASDRAAPLSITVAPV